MFRLIRTATTPPTAPLTVSHIKIAIVLGWGELGVASSDLLGDHDVLGKKVEVGLQNVISVFAHFHAISILLLLLCCKVKCDPDFFFFFLAPDTIPLPALMYLLQLAPW